MWPKKIWWQCEPSSYPQHGEPVIAVQSLELELLVMTWIWLFSLEYMTWQMFQYMITLWRLNLRSIRRDCKDEEHQSKLMSIYFKTSQKVLKLRNYLRIQEKSNDASARGIFYLFLVYLCLQDLKIFNPPAVDSW